MTIRRYQGRDLAIELLFACAALGLGFTLFCFMVLAFIFPFHNYHAATGIVEYENEVPLSMEKAGIIYRILVQPDEAVRAGQPVIELLNQADREEVMALDYKIEMKTQEVEKSQRLYDLGALEGSMVKARQTEERELLFQRQKLLTNTIRAPYQGFVYFTSSPQLLIGSYLAEGQIVAFLHRDHSKGVRIIESSMLVDRLSPMAPVKIYLENREVRHPQIRGRVEERIIDRARNSLSLFCSISEPKEYFEILPAGSSVKVSILIGSKSLFESFFGFNAFGAVRSRLGPGLSARLEKWLD